MLQRSVYTLFRNFCSGCNGSYSIPIISEDGVDVLSRAELLEAAPSLASILAKKLRDEIESRRLKVGDRFPTDSEIAEAFGVSRTVVREAVASLREAGLISTQRGRGSIVIANATSPSFRIGVAELEDSAQLGQLYEFRLMVERESVTLAVERHDAADLAALRACLQRGAQARDLDGAIDADIDFHLAIAAAARNEYFARLLSTVRNATIARALMRADLDDQARLALYLGPVIDEHRQIVAAIAARDADQARQVMAAHLAGARLKNLLNDSA